MDDTVRSWSGKHIFGIVILTGITVGAGFGFIAGTSPKIQHISILDVVLFHPTPTGMALYGATAAALGLALLLGIVLILSRFDQTGG